MILTFLRRWWVINRLYHFMKKADLSEVQMIHVPQLATKQEDFLKYLYNLRKNRKEPNEVFNKRIKNLINECIDNRNDYIDGSGNESDRYIALTTKGKEQYSVSHLIKIVLENAYIKSVIILIITIFVTNYVTAQIIDKVGDAVSANETKTPVSSPLASPINDKNLSQEITNSPLIYENGGK